MPYHSATRLSARERIWNWMSNFSVWENVTSVLNELRVNGTVDEECIRKT